MAGSFTKKLNKKATCRWATYIEQNNNRRDNVIDVIDGQKVRRSDSHLFLGLSRTQFYRYISKGFTPQEIKNKRLLLVLFIIFSFQLVFAQDSPYIAHFTTRFDTLVVNYQVQQSSNEVNWLTLASIQPKKQDSNIYSYTLPSLPLYYRILASMKGNSTIASKSILLDTSFNVHNIYTLKRQVYFTADNEKGRIKSYQILQSKNKSSNFTLFQTLTSLGDGDYISNRISTQQKYFRITAVFKTGVKKIITTRLITK